MAASATQSRAAQTRSDLIAKAAALAGHPDEASTGEYLQRYYQHVADEDLLRRRPEDLLGAATSQRELAAERPVGRANVRVFTPTVDEHGWATGHTVVEIVTDDMPFLVDSVTAELTQGGHAIHLVVHPQVVVRRDAEGRLVELVDSTTDARAELPYDCFVESWMHLEIDRQTERAALEAIATGLRRVLEDVREAVEDWSKMRERAEAIAEELGATPPQGVDSDEVLEARRLLQWLADDNFTFVGYREYTLESVDGEDVLRADGGTGLGVLRYDQKVSGSFGRLPAQVRTRAREPRLLILTEANTRSTVHRPAYLDYVGIKRFDADGHVVGERRFLGLFTSAAYNESVTRVPVVDRKVRVVLQRSGFSPESHSGKDLLEILETYPRDELFQADVDTLYDTALQVLHLQERRRTRLFVRRDDYGRYMSCLVYLPRDRYTTQVRLRMESILREAFDGVSVDYTTRVSESVLARLHFVVRVASGETIPDVDVDELEASLVAATRTWDEDLAEALREELGEEQGAHLAALYGRGFPEAYKEDFAPRVAVSDVQHLKALADDELQMNLYHAPGHAADERRFKLYRTSPLSLTAVLPVFSHLGVEVVDERPYELDVADGSTVYVYDFGLRYRTASWSPATDSAYSRGRDLFQDAFGAVWRGKAESDGFNALVLAGDLTWREIVVLRSYSKYLRQTGLTFSQEYVESCLVANVQIATSLVRLFEELFDPDRYDGRADAPERVEAAAAIADQITRALDDVASLDQDRILRALLGVVQATLRTSYFQLDEAGQHRDYVAYKLDPKAVPELPAPRPAYEIWVYSPWVEGVHLRFGAVARGGLRWSDRREDFRTEVLGLVKAQMVKNAVIVPTGAKGGFFPKLLPDASDREAFIAEGIRCYRTFISALLDVTDNIVGTREAATVVPPERVVRRDGDDTYLVVAADKGTASFSDIANEVARQYGFWLDDAFASGGSAGYDHKGMGITARGAWESVKRHFRELGVDVQTQDFTAVGIGDMSGDVFGNGMLRSRHTRLVAAFDHRHVFIDPDPDAERSFDERQRLFDLPRSSWADYDTSLISAGGGVWPRSAKSIPLSEQAARALGLGDSALKLSPAEVMQAVLKAPVDLLWNGGIGTYVKSSAESNLDVGDRANDAIRVNGQDLRVKVVGEGGNLGCTQLGRIETALSGVRINTDAIDNSAGVDTSDHEVNIKILLGSVVADGDLTIKQRNELLAQMTDQVAHLVLRDNYEQNVLLGNARQQAHSMLPVHARLIHHLEQHGHLDRAIEFLPSDATIARRHEENLGLTSPEFAVLVAYSKMTLAEDLLATDLPDDPWFHQTLRRYFPDEIVRRYDDRLSSHRLSREIITTLLVNNMVNRGGITFAFRAAEETSARPEQVARAYVVAREVFGLHDFVDRVEELDNVVPTSAQTALYLEFRRLMDRAVRWWLQSRPPITDIAGEIERYRGVVAQLRSQIPGMLAGSERDRLARRQSELVALGAPDELAMDAALLLDAFSLLDIVEISNETKTPAEQVAVLYFALSEHFQVDAMLGLITRLPRDDRWESLARASLRSDLYAALESLTTSVLTSTDADASPVDRIAAWERSHAEALVRVRATVGEVSHLEQSGIAALSVALRGLRGVVRSGASS
jgi:glutamate dehydrogenase